MAPCSNIDVELSIGFTPHSASEKGGPPVSHDSAMTQARQKW
jgi:hypothetical protein